MYIYKEENGNCIDFPQIDWFTSRHYFLNKPNYAFLYVCILLYKINIGDKFMVKNIQT